MAALDVEGFSLDGHGPYARLMQEVLRSLESLEWSGFGLIQRQVRGIEVRIPLHLRTLSPDLCLSSTVSVNVICQWENCGQN